MLVLHLLLSGLAILAKLTILMLKGAHLLWCTLWWGVAALSRRRAGRGKLTCPQGHVFDIDDVLLECSCGFRYEGSTFLCPNKECPEPSAAFTHCPTCSLSVPSPYRFGRAS